MNKWLRKLRGAIGIGIAWGATWLLAGLGLLAVVGLGAADVPFPLFFGFLGFLCGVTFGLLLAVVEGRRRINLVSIPRFATWGAVGAVALAGVMSLIAGAPFTVVGPIFAVAGAGCAAGTLALARLGQDAASLPEGRAGATRMGEERRERLPGES